MDMDKKMTPILEDGSPMYGEACLRARNSVIDFIINYKNPYDSNNPDYLEYEASFLLTLNKASDLWESFMRRGDCSDVNLDEIPESLNITVTEAYCHLKDVKDKLNITNFSEIQGVLVGRLTERLKELGDG